MPGASVFYKNAAGEIFHTYSTLRVVDSTRWSAPTTGSTSPPRAATKTAWPLTMAWVRHHDRYVDGQVVDINQLYVQPAKSGT